MKYYIIAGEASGDLHGSNLINGLRKHDLDAEIRCWGGDKMVEQGATLVTHYRETAIMGFIEVLKNFKKIMGFFSKAKSDILAFRPDVIVFIDYPGFNLRLAKWAKNQGFVTVYYITPTVWAWNKGRVHTLRKYIDLAIPILPFEKTFLDSYYVKCAYFGNPVLDSISNYRADKHTNPVVSKNGKPILAILPGSRIQEIVSMLPIMLKGAAMHADDYDIYVSSMSSIDNHYYDRAIIQSGCPNVTLIQDKTYDLLEASSIALVKSGTSTLEAALFDVPQVVCYIGSSISVAIAKRVLSIRYISLPNLIVDRNIVTELIQEDCNPEKISSEIKKLESHKEDIALAYATLKETIGLPGASERAARNIITLLKT